MIRRFYDYVPALCFALLLASCADSTGPADPGPASALRSAAQSTAEPAPATEDGCQVRAVDPGTGSWRRGRIPFHFRPSDRSPQGKKIRYTFVDLSSSGTLEAVAECVVPDTDQAVGKLNRRFGAASVRVLDRAEPEQDIVVASDCASCLEPIVVVACPAGAERDDTGKCVSTRPGDGETEDPGDGCSFDCGDEEWNSGGGGSQPYYGPNGRAPVGVDQAWFNLLNLPELTLCLAAPGDCAIVYSASKEARTWASQTAVALGFGQGVDQDGSWWNALLHARWNSNMAYGILGPIQAEIWANAHEWGNDATHPYTAMDLHNNAVGRRVSPGALTGAMGEMSVVLNY
jgi:hypothetical protein